MNEQDTPVVSDGAATWIWVAVIVVLLFSRGGCTPEILAPQAVTAVTYVHVVKGVIPNGVDEALNELNRRGIVATPYSADTTDAAGEIPNQYKIPNAKAKEAGLPALVVMAGDKFVRLVKDPKTKEQVLEASK